MALLDGRSTALALVLVYTFYRLLRRLVTPQPLAGIPHNGVKPFGDFSEITRGMKARFGRDDVCLTDAGRRSPAASWPFSTSCTSGVRSSPLMKALLD